MTKEKVKKFKKVVKYEELFFFALLFWIAIIPFYFLYWATFGWISRWFSDLSKVIIDEVYWVEK